MSEMRLKVSPMGAGWSVDCSLPLQPIYFRSGARAEEVARSLAVRLSSAGRDVHVTIHDRAKQVVGTQIYFAAEPGRSGLSSNVAASA
jgi:hypothetical protein